jgi:hypothetical protein
MRTAHFVLLLTLSIAPAGCTPWATYPPVEGTVELNQPTLQPIPTLMADAIRFAHDHYAPDHELVINLPPDTPAKVYSEVIAALGEGRPMTAEDETAFHVQTVRVRALTAEVDVIYPRMGHVHELATIRFRKKVLGRYEVENTRLWRFEVEVPGPNYIPPPEVEPEPVPAAEEELPALEPPLEVPHTGEGESGNQTDSDSV